MTGRRAAPNPPLPMNPADRPPGRAPGDLAGGATGGGATGSHRYPAIRQYLESGSLLNLLVGARSRALRHLPRAHISSRMREPLGTSQTTGN